MTTWNEIKISAGSHLALKAIQTSGVRLWSWAKDSDGNIGIAIEFRSHFFDTSNLEKTKEFKIEVNKSVSGAILTILCTNPDLKEQIEKFCLDLVEQTSNISNDIEFSNALKNRINAWCQLFKTGYKKLKHNQILGLAAELTFVSTWVNKMNELAEDWVGPLHNNQDFISSKNNLACEVKLSSWDALSVTISSIGQLDFDGTLKLIIYPGRIVDKDEDSSVNLTKVVEDLKQLLAPQDFLSVLNKLIIAGYDEQECEGVYFNIGDPIVYEVTEDFPKITNSNVHKNIVDCNYKLLLKNLESYKSTI